MRIRINKQLEMLCKILDTTPQEILQDFAHNLSLDYRHTSGSDARRMAVEYVLCCGYGVHLFNDEEIEHMFDELNAIRLSFSYYGHSHEKEYLKYRELRYKEFLQRWKELKAMRNKLK